MLVNILDINSHVGKQYKVNFYRWCMQHYPVIESMNRLKTSPNLDKKVCWNLNRSLKSSWHIKLWVSHGNKTISFLGLDALTHTAYLDIAVIMGLDASLWCSGRGISSQQLKST